MVGEWSTEDSSVLHIVRRWIFAEKRNTVFREGCKCVVKPEPTCAHANGLVSFKQVLG